MKSVVKEKGLSFKNMAAGNGEAEKYGKLKVGMGEKNGGKAEKKIPYLRKK